MACSDSSNPLQCAATFLGARQLPSQPSPHTSIIVGFAMPAASLASHSKLPALLLADASHPARCGSMRW